MSAYYHARGTILHNKKSIIAGTHIGETLLCDLSNEQVYLNQIKALQLKLKKVEITCCEIQKLREKLKSAEADLLHLQENFSRLCSSKSWQITKPLRFFNRLLNRLTGRTKSKKKILLKAEIQLTRDNLQEMSHSSSIDKAEVNLSDIKFDYALSPLVSIIIPVYGKYEYTLRCLKSIASYPPRCSYEIIIMDDASPDDAYQNLIDIAGLRVIRNASNLGFIRNCNKAADIARGEFLLFLNNDTEVLPDWCDALIETFHEYPHTGLAGSKFIFPDNKLQEAGGIIWKNGLSCNFGWGDDADKPEYNYVKEVDYCSGASICIRQSLFKHIGGFDEHYLPAYCEDSDLAFKIRAAGYKVIYQPFSRVYHTQGASYNVISDIQTHRDKNPQKLYTRWKDILEKENCIHEQNSFWARDRSTGKPVILIIDEAVPNNTKNGTVGFYLQFFAKNGFNVKLWTKDGIYDPVQTPYFQKMGIEVFYGQPCLDKFTAWLDQNDVYLNYIFISCPEVAEIFLPILKHVEHAKLLEFS